MLIVYSVTNVAYVCTIGGETRLLELLKAKGYNSSEYRRYVFSDLCEVEAGSTGIPGLSGLTFSEDVH